MTGAMDVSESGREYGAKNTDDTPVTGTSQKTRGEDALQYLLVHGCPPNVRTYTILINALCNDGSFDEATLLLSKMDTNDCLPDAVTFDTIIGALLKRNETEKAEKLRHEMMERGLVNIEKSICALELEVGSYESVINF
ncbi:unnamed protein product [Vicia faba]|uniref:Pentatricopeptide repeat-containing protein n=1 Tax=Vicia faba TaxID=3906 RepID=A0AAV0ZIW4_VICFA|nr:unnamed protein product [Vicia faba]